jgi:hypothetical protein
MNYFANEEITLLLRLLLAHLLTDFFLQPTRWVMHKKQHLWSSRFLWLHGAVTGAVAWLFLGAWKYWWVIFIITISHIVIDGIKMRSEKKRGSTTRTFLIDQLLHVFVLVISWLWIIRGWGEMRTAVSDLTSNHSVLLRVLAYLLMIGPVSYVIQFITRGWLAELSPEDSLRNAGKWIGILERVLTITFVFIHQFGAIGFLITAKSLLRVIDKPDKPNGEPTLVRPFSSRKRTEYVLIGTFLSFAIAIITGLLINYALA